MRLLFIILLFACFYQKSFSQTLVIAKIESGKIFLAADTRRVHQENILVNDTIMQVNICDTLTKVGSHNGVSFGLMGSFAQYDIIGLPLKFCKKDLPLISVVNSYAQAQVDTLLQVMPYLRKNDPRRYQRDYKNKGGFIKAIFTNYENGKPQILIVTFYSYEIADNLNIQYIITHSGETEEAIGHTSAIDNIFHLKKTWVGNTADAINRLFEKQIEATPDAVAKPLDLYIVDQNSVTYKRIK